MFAPVNPVAGIQPLNDWFVPDTTQRHPLGLRITAVDPVCWGLGTFIYIKSGAAILKGSLVMWDQGYNGALLPSTTGQGFPFGVAVAPMASGTYGWIQVEGLAVIKTNATVAADTGIAVAAAGIAGTLANGKQLVNCRNVRAATYAPTFTVQTFSGNGTLYFPNGYEASLGTGIALGLTVTGTGINASTTVIAALDPDGRRAYTGSAVGTTGDRNSSASGTITLTATYTGLGQAMLNNPHAQDQAV